LGWFAFGAIVLHAAACGSSGGGGFPDTGTVSPKPEAGTSHDAASDSMDSAVMRRDVTSIFGDTGGGMPDVTTDAPPPPDGPANDARDAATPDGGTHHDAGEDVATHADTGTKDAAPMKDAGCVVVDVPTDTGGLGACPAPVTGSCGPGSLTSFTPTSPPPAPRSNACTPAQIESIYDGCLNGGDCTTAANAAMPCYNCIFTLETDAKWGPMVSRNAADPVAYLNFGGCVTLTEPCNAACGDVLEEDLECEQAACATNCPVQSQYENCTSTIDNCNPKGCALYYVGTSCASNLTGPATQCFATPTDQKQTFLTVAGIFCAN
jgi:hypothetical protein